MNELKDKSAKRANLLFLICVCISLITNIFVSIIHEKGIELNILANLFVSQMIILIPGLIFFVINMGNGNYEGMYNRIRPVSIFLFIVFTWLLMPLASLANVFSQLFTTNEVLAISGQVLELPLWVMVFIIGILGPFCEEFVFRGVIYRGLKGKSERYIASGIVSALFFGLMHMNLNQFCYAFILGMAFALINEAMDSMWPSFVCHAVLNTQNVIMLYITDKMLSREYSGGIAQYYNELYGKSSPEEMNMMNIAMLVLFLALLMASVVCTLLAALLLFGICKIEHKEERLKNIFAKKINDNEHRILFPTAYFAIGICLFFMFLLEPVIKMLKK